MSTCKDAQQALNKIFKKGDFPDSSSFCVHDLLKDKKIFLYGAGDGFITFSMFVLKKYNLKAYAILDRKFVSGQSYFGISACNPDEFQPSEDERENAVVVVTVGKKKYYADIKRCLGGLGFQNVIFAHDIYEYHLHYSSVEFEGNGFGYYLQNREKIMNCLELFSDDLSCEVYRRFMETHMLRRPVHIPNHNLEDQYFPKDVTLSKGYSRFINCGAYTGDTVIRLNALVGKIKALACFEPDRENFGLLAQYLCAQRKRIADDIAAFPCGVYSHETQMRFAAGDKINSAISAQGESIIQCVALDHVLPGFSPTLIQMDVEGAELEALRGAETLIRECRPDLAICVYHVPSHIWDIPLYLSGLGVKYKYYLRNYTSYIAETVLYATE